MPTLNKIQIASDWTGGRKPRVIDRLLPVLLPPEDDQSYRSDFLYRNLRSSYYRSRVYTNPCYKYMLPTGSLLSEKHHGKSLLRQKWHKSPYLTEHQKAGLSLILVRDIGLGKRMADVITSRPYLHYLRIEEFISGFVDSLWLADELCFLEESSDRKLILNTIRKIFRVGAFNLVKLVSDWKEFGNYVFHSMAETLLIGGGLALSGPNMFRSLIKLSFVKHALKYKDHRDMQNVGHLMSSRQMPYMGLQTEISARETFKEVLTSDYRPPSELVIQMGKVAARIGKMCKRLSPGPIPKGALHISVTCSGELEHSFKKGAQARAVRDAFERIMSVVPEEDLEEETPFGICKHIKGIPLWKTAYRPEPLNLDRELFEEFDLIEGQPRMAGLDEYAGIQIMYCAWKERDKTPFVRAEVVPEMGNKARHVTVSAYWLNILQAPLGHALIEALKWHPSCFSSFHREDQAWEAAKQLCRAKQPLGPNEYILSSDLKDATNAQQWLLSKVMLRAFAQGYGFHISPYVDLAIETLGPRLVQTHDDDIILSNVGIMMGEPLAKPSLTLLNLCIEELAFLEYTHSTDLLETADDSPDPHKVWRCFHVGGDDHLARGPLPYLERITELHRLCGSHIDPGKHGYSRVCVKYTERVLDLRNLQREKPLDVDHSDYSRSVIVDTIKVRLLERGLSTEQRKDNKNVAIGKAKQLGKTLEWLPDDSRYYDATKIESIRELFIKRMGGFLPKEKRNPRAFAQIHLPETLGGFGLGARKDIKKYLLESPKPVQYLVAKKLSFKTMGFEQDMAPDVKVFRKLNSNTSVRGSEKVHEYMEQKIEKTNLSVWNESFFDPNGFYSMYGVPERIETKFASWAGIKLIYYRKGDNAKKIKDRASIDGWIPVDEYANRCARGLLFQTLISGTEELKPYNTAPYTTTYRNHVWKWYEKEGGESWDLSVLETTPLEEIMSSIDEMRTLWYINTKKITVQQLLIDDSPYGNTGYRNKIFRGELLDAESIGLPSLQIDNRYLGIFRQRTH